MPKKYACCHDEQDADEPNWLNLLMTKQGSENDYHYRGKIEECVRKPHTRVLKIPGKAKN